MLLLCCQAPPNVHLYSSSSAAAAGPSAGQAGTTGLSPTAGGGAGHLAKLPTGPYQPPLGGMANGPPGYGLPPGSSALSNLKATGQLGMNSLSNPLGPPGGGNQLNALPGGYKPGGQFGGNRQTGGVLGRNVPDLTGIAGRLGGEYPGMQAPGSQGWRSNGYVSPSSRQGVQAGAPLFPGGITGQQPGQQQQAAPLSQAPRLSSFSRRY